MMTTNIHQDGLSPEVEALDRAIRELGVGISVAEGRVQDLVRRAFSNEHTATNGLRTLLKRTQSIEAVIAVLQADTLKRHWHFGQTRDGWLFFGQRAGARMALAELPEALRELDQLTKKQRELARGRSIHVAMRVPAAVDHHTDVQQQHRRQHQRM